jgi:hypothetical protein
LADSVEGPHLGNLCVKIKAIQHTYIEQQKSPLMVFVNYPDTDLKACISAGFGLAIPT